MAKRSPHGARRTGGRTTMAQVAKEFTAAEQAYRELEGKLAAQRERLVELRRALLSHLGEFQGGKSARSSSPAARPARRGAKRSDGPRDGSLGSFIVSVMNDGKHRGVADIAGALRATKYKSKSSPKSQSVMINQTLGKLAKSGHLTKVGRGVYASNTA